MTVLTRFTGAEEPIELNYHASEVDKVGEWWVVRYYPNQEVELQLKIRHFTYEFPAECVCEVRLREIEQWVELARFWCDPMLLRDDVQDQPDLSLFPHAWGQEFAAMARHWGLLLAKTHFASTLPHEEA